MVARVNAGSTAVRAHSLAGHRCFGAAVYRDIMVQLHPRVFEASPAERAEDAALFRRCQCLQFLTASNLDVPASCNNDVRDGPVRAG